MNKRVVIDVFLWIFAMLVCMFWRWVAAKSSLDAYWALCGALALSWIIIGAIVDAFSRRYGCDTHCRLLVGASALTVGTVSQGGYMDDHGRWSHRHRSHPHGALLEIRDQHDRYSDAGGAARERFRHSSRRSPWSTLDGFYPSVRALRNDRRGLPDALGESPSGQPPDQIRV